MGRGWSFAAVVLVAMLSLVCLAGCGNPTAGTDAGMDPGLFGIHLSNRLGTGYDETFAAFSELGATWVRTSIPWEKVEPENGAFDWENTDRMVEAASEHDIHLLITIRALSTWGCSRVPANWSKPGYHAAVPPADMAEYEEFVRAFVGRYSGRGVAWQIDNEPNAKAFWDGTMQEYLALLEAGYTAAHEADPGAVVLPAGLACGFSLTGYPEEKRDRIGDWFTAILDTEAHDALDMHDYYPAEGANPWGIAFGEYIDWHRVWMDERSVDAPLWMSEAGVPSEPITIGGREIGHTESRQASGLEAIYETSASKGIAHVFWLKLVDTDEYSFSSMGLMTDDLVKKPAWESYRDLAKSDL
ncbi:MAG: beta-galactosidase [Actinobacteria bacterium]|nr:beta-galactosidase [Actinomycetota bacterium]MBU1944327.1 beta-galactosidase [Actinomycetota bacterium]MBU2688312.1 beta-galactosidase [Actinomycetota bacterium]